MYHVTETKGRYYNSAGQRISRATALMLIECNRAYMAAL